MPQLTLDTQAIPSESFANAQFQLNLHITEQSDEAAVYEIDSIPDVFGDLYRV